MKFQTMIYFLLFSLFIHLNSYSQVQIGGSINGAAAEDQLGSSVSLSADGTRIAVGSLLNDDNGNNTGHVRIYEESGGVWSQIGADINGSKVDDQSARSISLSADGSRIAISSILNDDNGMNAGQVKLYEENGGIWSQIGADINGENAEDNFGFSVSLSSDGMRVAIGAILNDGTATNAGHVRIYEESGGIWSQIGADIDGEAANDASGFSVSINSDGSRVAIGARTNAGNGFFSGHVRVYEDIAGTWTQVGNDIDGESFGDLSGVSVSISANGNRVAIGAEGNDAGGSNSGHVRIFEEVNNVWNQVGNDIDGKAGSEKAGKSLSLSSDGLFVAIGVTGSQSNGSFSGSLRLYQENAGVWSQVGSDINGEQAHDLAGSSVAISADGTRVAVGEPQNDEGGNFAGRVRVFTNLALPVALSSFTAKEIIQAIQLKWTSSNERNNAGFEIQKSKNGQEWNKITFINGAGTTDEDQEYTYQDENPFSGVNYYRLKQIDFDGTFEYSKIIKVEYRQTVSSIQVFPNPANSPFTIHINNPNNQAVHIQITDNFGRIIWRRTLTEQEVNLGKEMEITKTGLYLITAQIGNEISRKRMLIIK